MVMCPRCGAGVAHLHPLPPEVITKDLIAAVGNEEPPMELEACSRCITVLMESG